MAKKSLPILFTTTAPAIKCLLSSSIVLIEQMVVITPGEIIDIQSLPDRWKGSTADRTLPAIGERPLNEIMSELERSLLEQAVHLHKTTRNIAKVLQINQSPVVRKLKRYDIKNDDG